MKSEVVLAMTFRQGSTRIQHMQASGIVPLLQQSSGIGGVRREALSRAAEYFPDAKYICWIEPEKQNMVKFIFPMVQCMRNGNWCLGLFNRRSMKSYPAEQAHYHLFFRAVASKFLGRDVDYAFGPMMCERTMLPYFLSYESKYGDLWDSLLIPRLEIIKDGHSYGTQEIDFRNDHRMTQIESGNAIIIKKRLQQFENVGQSLLNKMTP